MLLTGALLAPAFLGTMARAERIGIVPVKADLVVVEKSKRRLYLLHDARVIRVFPVALGFDPVGTKEHAGDGRTPEGFYVLDRRNAGSAYYRSIHISYPNAGDVARARADGYSPGGAIMIHGFPAWVPTNLQRGYLHQDWTEGCISVTDHAMDQIWSMVADGTTIDIRP